MVPIPHPYAVCLEDRHFIYQSNPTIKGNKPVTIGYNVSTVGFNCREEGIGWNPPLSMRHLSSEDNAKHMAVDQLDFLLADQSLPFGGHLTVNCLDSAYSHPFYLAPGWKHANLVSISRINQSRNVFEPYKGEQKGNGAHKYYGTKYPLKELENLRPCDAQQEWEDQLVNGKKIKIRLQRWDQLLLRGKRGYKMSDKPFQVIKVWITNLETGEPLHKREMWLMVSGQRQNEINLESTHYAYKDRFDIEGLFRFSKQKLFLSSFLSEERWHQQAWLQVVVLAYWMLFSARKTVKIQPYEWEKYLDRYKQKRKLCTPSQCQRGLEAIILGYDQTPFQPRPSINGKGRKKGQTQTKRIRHPVVKKGGNRQKV